VPTPENLNKFFVHLTNYSLNKRNPDFTVNKNDPNSNSGHKRTLSSTYLLLEKLGHDVPKLKQEIYDIVVKTVISGLPAISHQYRYCQPEYE
jgi:tubulin polyglutamylase TTLL6/13